MRHTITFALLLLLAFGCGTIIEVSSSRAGVTELRATCEERVPGEWWATIERPGVLPDQWSRAGVVLDVPEGAGESMGLDPSLRFYRAPLVVFDEGRLDVWCGDTDVSTAALVFLPEDA